MLILYLYYVYMFRNYCFSLIVHVNETANNQVVDTNLSQRYSAYQIRFTIPTQR